MLLRIISVFNFTVLRLSIYDITVLGIFLIQDDLKRYIYITAN